MKLAILAGLALALAFVTLTSSCEINHRSEEFACTKNIDCPSGRICNDGFCIITGSIDASRGDAQRGDAGANCPAGCTSCNTTEKTCTINCMLTNCTNTVSCPAGYKCDIACNTEQSCRNGINCQLAASCNIDCIGRQSCQNVQCGPGRCDVSCSGAASCRGVSCGSSCACDVACTGNQSCADNITCSSVACRSGSGCTSVPLFCHSCN